GYTDPSVSPDGEKVAFVHRRSGKAPYFRSDILVSGSDGSGQARVLTGNRKRFYSSPGWTPDGRRMIVAFYRIDGWKQFGGVLSLKPDGSEHKVIFRLKAETIRNDWSSASAIASPVMSPDGRKVLFVRLTELVYDDSGNLEVANLATGRTTVVARWSLGGSWSPDGTQIVHSRSASGDDGICSARGCVRGGRLFTINADGTGSKRLIPGRGFESEADWSNDGSRIVFQSNRNMPDSPDAYEVYSVDSGGGCLTWLTNGSPASTAPAWLAKPGEETSPEGCGSVGRRPLIEIPSPVQSLGRLAPEAWLGEQFHGLLVSDAMGRPAVEGLSLRYSALIYGDCARFGPSACGLQLETIEYPVCAVQGDIAEDVLGARSVKIRRGVPYVRSIGDGAQYDWVLSGPRIITVYRDDSATRPTRRQILDGIRAVGVGEASEPAGELPAAELPAIDIRRMKRVVRTFRQSGPVRRTADKLGMKPRAVRANLRMHRLLRKIAPVRTVNCPKVPSK
ncbi:MAG: hypothetical protein M3Y23_01855, partial [Actinomycetota bacterium]|nr:hypothetical protein [Actinomycetota bacterium]